METKTSDFMLMKVLPSRLKLRVRLCGPADFAFSQSKAPSNHCPLWTSQAADQIKRLYDLFLKVDATQVEVNPFGETPEGQGILCVCVCVSSKHVIIIRNVIATL